MENEFITLGMLIFFILCFLVKKGKDIDDSDLIQLISDVHKKEELLKNINFCISEVGRISQEKTKAIKAHDWDLLKELWKEEELLNIKFNLLK